MQIYKSKMAVKFWFVSLLFVSKETCSLWQEAGNKSCSHYDLSDFISLSDQSFAEVGLWDVGN